MTSHICALALLLLVTSFTLFAGTTKNADACHCPSLENPSPYLRPGTAIRDLAHKVSWGKLVKRLVANNGWWLDNGRRALDTGYGRTWEIEALTGEESKLLDADKNELYGDHDKLWFKIRPAKSDALAYEIYMAVGKNTLSTDGFHDKKLYLIYKDRSGSVHLTSSALSILKYLTKTKPENPV